MVAKISLIVGAVCVFNLVHSLPETFPGFHPCKSSDDECLLDNAKNGVEFFANGIPSLDVKRLDPLTFKRVDSSSPNLKFILYDATLTGLKTCKPLKATHDIVKTQMVLVTQCDLKVDGDYELDGRILILTLKGKGKIHIFLKNIVTTTTINYFIKEGKNGKKYIRVKNFNQSYELKDKTDISFEDLFQDNNVLNQAVDDLIKNNGNEIIQDIGNEMFTASSKEIVENIKRFVGKIPIDEISLDLS